MNHESLKHAQHTVGTNTEIEYAWCRPTAHSNQEENDVKRNGRKSYSDWEYIHFFDE